MLPRSPVSVSWGGLHRRTELRRESTPSQLEAPFHDQGSRSFQGGPLCVPAAGSRWTWVMVDMWQDDGRLHTALSPLSRFPSLRT